MSEHTCTATASPAAKPIFFWLVKTTPVLQIIPALEDGYADHYEQAKVGRKL